MARNTQQLLDANCQPQVSREPDAFPGRGTELRPAVLADGVGRSDASVENSRSFWVSALCLGNVGEGKKKNHIHTQEIHLLSSVVASHSYSA